MTKRNKTTEASTDEKADAQPSVIEKVEKVDHVATFTKAAITFLTDGNVEALQSVYRAIPAAARATALTKAQMAMMVADGFSVEKMTTFLDAVNNLPTVSVSRTQKVELTDWQRDVILRAAFLRAAEVCMDTLTEAQSFGIVATLQANERLIDTLAAKLIGASQKVTFGGKQQIGVTLADLVRSNDIPIGAKLTGPNNAECVVIDADDDGHVKMGDDVFDSLSAAATKASGTSSNGWLFWSYGDRKVGAYRLAD